MGNCLYQFVQSFQSLIVGGLGFFGVIFTLYINARLSRRQHERNVSHEEKTLRVALRAELELARRTFADVVSSAGDASGDQGAFFSERQSNSIYKSLIPKIGLLSVDEVCAIAEAHALIGELPIRLHLLSHGHDDSFERPGYIYISAQNVETAISIYRNFLPKIERALEALKMAG